MKRVVVCILIALGTALAQPPAKLAMRPARTEAHGGFVSDMDCSACHTADGWKLSTAAGKSGFDHDRTGFPLRGQHARTTCVGCHTGKQPARTCEGCHRDPHERRHDEPCAECHTAVAWSDTTFEQHRRTRMPLTGKHALIECTACHARQGGRTWSDVPVDCYGCHRDRFHDRTVHPVHDGSSGEPMFSRDCGQCHRTIAWTPAVVVDPNALARQSIARSGRHDPFFVLSSGSHGTAPCTSCHVDARRTRQVRCDGCHDGLALQQQHRGRARASAAAACLRCHPRGAAR